MIEGHGDDLYSYGGKIKYNFSSNIFSGVDHSRLTNYMASFGMGLDSYPEPNVISLEEKLAGCLGVNRDNVMVSNGATEAIYMIAHSFKNDRSAVVIPSFSEYEDACVMYDHDVEYVTSIDDMPDDVSVVWLCNPNNPTGKVYPKGRLMEVIESNKDITFVIDQAYADYTVCPVVSDSEAVKDGNVLLLGSFTKRFSVPGLRVGYMVGDKDLVRRVKSYRLPWSVGGPAMAGAKYLIDHITDYTIDVNGLHCEALRLADEFFRLGISVEPTDCNFILCKLPVGCASEQKINLALKHGILIRDASNFRGLDSAYFRVAAQTQDANDILISAVKEWITL